MSLEQFSGMLHRNPNLDDNSIAQILTMWQQLNPPIDDTADQELDIISNPTRLRSTTVAVNPPDEIIDYTKSRATGMYRRRVPQQVTVFGPTVTKTGTVTYPNLIATPFSQKFGCEGIFNGSQCISFSDNSRITVGSGKTAFAVWYKTTGTGTYGLLCKRNISNTTNAGIEIWIDSGNQVLVRIADGVNTLLFGQTVANLNDGSWHSIVVNIPDTGDLEIWVDNTLRSTNARGSVGSLNNSRDAYFFARDNAGTPQDLMSGSIALAFWKKGEIFSSGQIDDYHTKGIIDTSGGSSVDCVMIPYSMKDTPEPDAYVSLCMAHH